jgi:hypothetical protein
MSEALATYLKDHYAGAAGGGELCRRIAESAAGDIEAKDVNSIAAEIDKERTTLKEMMGRLGVSPSLVKATGAWVGEKAGRVKLRASDEAGRVLQYESMIMGVTGKLQLWNSLLEIEPRVAGLQRPELEQLARQAEDQRSRLQRWHDTAAKNLHGVLKP